MVGKTIQTIMSNPNQTPLKEATSLITIGAILVAMGCYTGAVQNVPGLAPGVLWLAGLVIGWLPALNALHGAQIPLLVGSGTVGHSRVPVWDSASSLVSGWLRQSTASKCRA